MANKAQSEFESQLANVPALIGLPTESFRSLLQSACLHSAAAGDTLLREGDDGDSLLILLQGAASIYSTDADGDQQRLATVTAGTLLGEMSLMTSQPHRASVMADTDCSLAILPVTAVERLMREAPEFGGCLADLIAGRIGAASGDVLIGETLHGYQVQELLGRGGMGTVYRAIHQDDGTVVALKMMSHSFIYNQTAVARFSREASIITALKHPNIVCVYSHFAEFLTRFLVMEYCDGPDVSQLISLHNPLQEADARAILGQISGGLKFAHDNQIVHRDLKPSNVILTRDGVVKLMDFGLAKSSSNAALTSSRACVGTPRYMAPEQLAGHDVDYRADLYALGCVAYELIIGQPLYNGPNTAAELMKRFSADLPLRETMPQNLSNDYFDLICRCLSVDPDARDVDLTQLTKWADSVKVNWAGGQDQQGITPDETIIWHGNDQSTSDKID